MVYLVRGRVQHPLDKKSGQLIFNYTTVGSLLSVFELKCSHTLTVHQRSSVNPYQVACRKPVADVFFNLICCSLFIVFPVLHILLAKQLQNQIDE